MSFQSKRKTNLLYVTPLFTLKIFPRIHLNLFRDVIKANTDILIISIIL